MVEELFDIVDENGHLIGETTTRAKAHENGSNLRKFIKLANHLETKSSVFQWAGLK